MEKKFYTVEEVADMLGFAPKMIRNLITDGLLEAVKIRTTYRITPEQIDAFIKNNTTSRRDQKIDTSEDDPKLY